MSYPPNLWEEVARYGEGGLIVYCSKLAEYHGTDRLIGQAFVTPLDVSILNALVNDRAIYVNQRCALMVQTIDNVVAMMRGAMQRAMPRRPLGKQPTGIPSRAVPPTLGLLLSQARTAAAQGQTNVARVLYNRYLSRMSNEMPGVRPATLF